MKALTTAKLLIYLLLHLSVLGALEITINYGKENSQNFSVLNLQHTEAFLCQELSNAKGVVTRIVCVINKTPNASFAPANTIFFKFWSRVVDGKFYFYIEPNFSAKLFNTFIDLRSDTPIPKERPKKSKSWQIVGFKDTLPFLSRSTSHGLNFPIHIAYENEGFIGELGVDRMPLGFDDEEDFTPYLGIQNLIKNKLYIDAIKAIDETLASYPNGIFAKDLLYLRIKALQELDSQNNADSIIDISLKWIKRYPADMNVPEILYYIGQAYVNIRFQMESKYYYDRIINEYPNSRFAPLSKMQLAATFYGTQDFANAQQLFAQAYQEAKDLDSASTIAITWSEFYLRLNKKKEAKALVDTLFQANPTFFIQNPLRTINFAKLLSESDLWENAAKISEYLYTQFNDDEALEAEALNIASLNYQKNGDFEKAHEINAIFLERFSHRPRAGEFRARDDKLLFEIGVNDSDEEKIKRYDYLIATYPQTAIESKAKDLKSQILYDQGRYEDVLKIDPTSPIAQKSYTQIIKLALVQKNCKKIAQNFPHYDSQYFDETEKIDIFHCLYSLSLNKEAAQVIEGMAQNQKDPKKKLDLLYLEALNLDKLALNKPTILASRDALNLAKSLKMTRYYDVGFVLFKNLMLARNYEEANELGVFLKENLADDGRMVDVNLSLLKNAQNSKDEVATQAYAKDILRLQAVNKNTNGSPYADFALAQSNMKEARYEESLKILEDLLKKDISPDAFAQALYLKASIYKATRKDTLAKESFSQCKELRNASAKTWQNLCAQALDLLP
ncbi:MAG: flagellar protein [Helicobacter sp.]|nr:flagellar protein [Helicobacter sp.]